MVTLIQSHPSLKSIAEHCLINLIYPFIPPSLPPSVHPSLRFLWGGLVRLIFSVQGKQFEANWEKGLSHKLLEVDFVKGHNYDTVYT